MGQVLRNDRIGNLTSSAGYIQMAASLGSPAYITIGGSQYKVTSNLSVVLPSMTAATRYQIYAVISNGTISLAISTRENSLGPLGFSGWKLIGAFYSNGASPVAFGDFCTIEGAPVTGWIYGGPLVLTASTTPPTKGATRTADEVYFMVNGELVVAKMNYRQTSAGTDGSGDYMWTVPIPINTVKHIPNTTVWTTGAPSPEGSIGQFRSNGGGTGGQLPSGEVFVFDTNRVKATSVYDSDAGTSESAVYGAGINGFATAANQMYLEMSYAGTGMSNVPLKDR